MPHFMADGDAVYELSLDAVGQASRRLISDSEETMDAIIREAHEEWIRTRPFTERPPVSGFRRLQIRIGYAATMARQWLHDALFGDGYHCRDCY